LLWGWLVYKLRLSQARERRKTIVSYLPFSQSILCSVVYARKVLGLVTSCCDLFAQSCFVAMLGSRALFGARFRGMEPGPLGERVAQQALADVPVGQAYDRHRMFLQTTAALLHDWERGRLWADNAASLVCHAADAYRRDVGRVALPSSRDHPGQDDVGRVALPSSRDDPGQYDVGRVALPSSRGGPGQYPCAPRGMDASRGSMDMPPAAPAPTTPGPDSLTLGDLFSSGTLTFRASPQRQLRQPLGRGPSRFEPVRSASPGYTFSDASVFGGRGSSDRAPCRRRSRSRGDGVSKSASVCGVSFDR